MRIRSVLIAVGCGVVVTATGGAAFAGEYNGSTGSDTGAPSHANSVCAYSGLDHADSVEGPGFPDDAVAVRGNQSPDGVARYHGVQNYGDYVRAGMKSDVPSPGVACNPTKSAG